MLSSAAPKAHTCARVLISLGIVSLGPSCRNLSSAAASWSLSTDPLATLPAAELSWFSPLPASPVSASGRVSPSRLPSVLISSFLSPSEAPAGAGGESTATSMPALGVLQCRGRAPGVPGLGLSALEQGAFVSCPVRPEKSDPAPASPFCRRFLSPSVFRTFLVSGPVQCQPLVSELLECSRSPFRPGLSFLGGGEVEGPVSVGTRTGRAKALPLSASRPRIRLPSVPLLT